MAKKPMHVVKVKDYGDDWINRLAVVMVTLQKMGPREREATLALVFGKYQQRVEMR